MNISADTVGLQQSTRLQTSKVIGALFLLQIVPLRISGKCSQLSLLLLLLLLLCCCGL